MSTIAFLKIMGNKRVLIIDNELDICLLLSNYLKKNGLEPVYKTSLQEGIKTAQELKPEIIFLDHNMPDGFGIENIQVFKSISPCNIFVISAMGNLRDDALKNGASYFFEKPLSFPNIKEILETKTNSNTLIG